MTTQAIVIGASTGGPKALEILLTQLPQTLEAIIIVIQHLSFQFTTSMAVRLSNKTPILMSQMGEGDLLLSNHIYLVPGNTHFLITSSGPRVRLLPAYELVHPCIDTGFTSVAEHFGPHTIGVILTGMGTDGVMGAKAIKQLGGIVIVQDEETSAVFGMPKAVQIAGFADAVLPLEKIAKKLIQLTSRSSHQKL